MTSIEWLVNQLSIEQYPSDIPKIIEEAKKLHKQQIIDAYNKSFELRDKPYSTADKYYTSTYGSKGSDETKYYEQSRGINIDSFQSEAPKKQDYIVKVTDVTSSQTEISDEEIEKYAKQNAFQYYEFIQGVKWYREQLKKRQ